MQYGFHIYNIHTYMDSSIYHIMLSSVHEQLLWVLARKSCIYMLMLRPRYELIVTFLFIVDVYEIAYNFIKVNIQYIPTMHTYKYNNMYLDTICNFVK